MKCLKFLKPNSSKRKLESFPYLPSSKFSKIPFEKRNERCCAAHAKLLIRLNKQRTTHAQCEPKTRETNNIGFGNAKIIRNAKTIRLNK